MAFGFGFNSSISTTATGRVGKDPEKKTFGDGDKAKTMVSFSLAIDQYNPKDPKKPDTLWVRVKMFNEKPGALVMQYVKQGAIVQVVGTPKLNSWKDKDGGSHTDLELNADSVVKLWSKKDESGSESAAPAEAHAAAASAGPDPADDIPF